jgi:hypothetical protein
MLDWGNEDEELHMHPEAYRRADFCRGGEPDDAEEAVSLGGDDEDYETRFREEHPNKSSLSAKPAALHQPQPNRQSSQESQLPPPTPSQKAANSQGSPQQSPLRPHSLSKITHALPPKPVVAIAPFVHPSHPSIIEATAMSRSRTDRDKKLNGTVAKSGPAASDMDPLPPDWELRHPRNGARGVYYYNVRTYESTWTRPVNSVQSPFSKDQGKAPAPAPDSRSGAKNSDSTGTKGSEQNAVSRRGRSDAEPQVSSVLSYQDRHYRPGADNTQKPSQDANRREERALHHNASHTHRSFTPPASPKPERARSPPLVAREQDRRQPSSHHRQSSPRESAANGARSRDFQRDDFRSPIERHSSSRNLPSEASSRHQAGPSTNSQPQAIGMEKSETPVFQGLRSDTVWPTPSTLSASTPLTSRVWRINSSRGGGRIVPQRLAKPRELNCAPIHFSFPRLLPRIDKWTLMLDSSVLFYLHFSPFLIPFSFFDFFHIFLSCHRTQISSAALEHISVIPSHASIVACAPYSNHCP